MADQVDYILDDLKNNRIIPKESIIEMYKASIERAKLAASLKPFDKDVQRQTKKSIKLFKLQLKYIKENLE